LRGGVSPPVSLYSPPPGAIKETPEGKRRRAKVFLDTFFSKKVTSSFVFEGLRVPFIFFATGTKDGLLRFARNDEGA
jgi:hypothetical protein